MNMMQVCTVIIVLNCNGLVRVVFMEAEKAVLYEGDERKRVNKTFASMRWKI
jgi:hypothetical protein